MANEIRTQNLSIQSLGTLDKNKAGLQKDGAVNAEHYDQAQTFLRSLDSTATVRIVNGRSKNQALELSTKSNKGNFYSRKPVTTEFFKQACIAKFSNGKTVSDVATAFDRLYQRESDSKPINSAGHFRAVMDALESEFASPDAVAIHRIPVWQASVHEPQNVNDEIRALGAKLATHDGQSQNAEVRDQLVHLLKTGVTEPASARAVFLRDHLDTLSSLLYFDFISPVASDGETATNLESLRNERDAIADLAQIKLILDSLELEHFDPNQEAFVPMPWYFLRGSDGSIAVLDHATYSHLQLGTPNDKIMESIQIFSTAQGQVKSLNGSEKKQEGRGIVELFPPLKAYLNSPRVASASSDLTRQLFEQDPDVNGWLQLALKGVRQELSDPQKVQLGDAFMRGAEAVFMDLSHLDSPQSWPQAQMKDDFVEELRQLASATSQVVVGNNPAFAHFLFALSATFTRLSSVASLGDDAGSIPQLRYLGYVLSRTAQSLHPNLLDAAEWADVNKNYLDSNACAKLLSDQQFKISKSLNPDEFQRFVPQVFQEAAI